MGRSVIGAEILARTIVISEMSCWILDLKIKPEVERGASSSENSYGLVLKQCRLWFDKQLLPALQAFGKQAIKYGKNNLDHANCSWPYTNWGAC